MKPKYEGNQRITVPIILRDMVYLQEIPTNSHLPLIASLMILHPPHPLLRVFRLPDTTRHVVFPIDGTTSLHQPITVAFLSLEAVWMAASLVVTDEVAFA